MTSWQSQSLIASGATILTVLLISIGISYCLRGTKASPARSGIAVGQSEWLLIDQDSSSNIRVRFARPADRAVGEQITLLLLPGTALRIGQDAEGNTLISVLPILLPSVPEQAMPPSEAGTLRSYTLTAKCLP